MVIAYSFVIDWRCLSTFVNVSFGTFSNEFNRPISMQNTGHIGADSWSKSNQISDYTVKICKAE